MIGLFSFLPTSPSHDVSCWSIAPNSEWVAIADVNGFEVTHLVKGKRKASETVVHSHIKDLVVDHHGNVWIGAENGLWLRERNHQSVRKIDGRSTERVWLLPGTLAVVASDGGSQFVICRSGKVQQVVSLASYLLPNSPCLAARDGTLVLPTLQEKLYPGAKESKQMVTTWYTQNMYETTSNANRDGWNVRLVCETTSYNNAEVFLPSRYRLLLGNVNRGSTYRTLPLKLARSGKITDDGNYWYLVNGHHLRHVSLRRFIQGYEKLAVYRRNQ